jgi:hypothetical protein
VDAYRSDSRLASFESLEYVVLEKQNIVKIHIPDHRADQSVAEDAVECV